MKKNSYLFRIDYKFILLFVTILFLSIPITNHAQELLSFPQKIVIDREHNRLLVSNFGDGALVEIDPDGNQEYFDQYAGFNDGMDIVDNIVYGVGSERRLIAYDLDSEEQLMEFSFPGNSDNYLSSVTSDSSGHLFISCPALHTIYRFRISDQSYWIFAQDNGLNRPNGIFLERENDRIVVIDDSPGQSIIHAISLTDSTVSTLLETNLDRPDGIVRARTGEYYIGGYYLDGLYTVDSDFSSAPELYFEGNNMVYPTYDKSDHSILITRYLDHDWERILLPGGTILGTVSTTPNIDPGEIEIIVDNRILIPDPTGIFTVRLPLGLYDVTAYLENYETIIWSNAEIIEDQITSVFFMLSYLQPPESLVAELNENNVSLTWEHFLPAERTFQSFRIYRNIDGGEFELYAATTELTYGELLEPGAEYGYYITALYEQENESESSNIVYVSWDGVDDIIDVQQNTLFQNYPNPFNPRTSINFYLSENHIEQKVEIVIYNLKGEKVKDLIHQTMASGLHTVSWNGKDNNGFQVPSGTYFCELKTNGTKIGIQKILLLK